MEQISYEKLDGWKYRLADEYEIHIRFFEGEEGRGNEYVWLEYGRLAIRKGYAWDGPSGPTWDTPNWMRASLVHDAMYQLIRESHLPIALRKQVDLLMLKALREDGMSRARSRTAYIGVRMFGRRSAHPRPVRKILRAP